MFKKVIATLCAMTLVMSLVACGDGAKETTPSTQATNKGTEAPDVQGTEEPSTSEEPVGPGSITYPLDTDVSISYWNGARYSNQYQSWKESPAHQDFLKAVGVDIDFRYVMAGSNQTQDFNLLLQDEKLPTCLYYLTTPVQAEQFIADGVIYDITDYLPKYAPDFWEFVNRPEQADVLTRCTTPDGRFFCMPEMYETHWGSNYIGPIIRQDWLDECGLEVPVTLEDWEKVLVTFKDKYNAGFGAPEYRMASLFVASGADALGFLNASLVLNDDGKVVIPQIEPEWKELMEVASRWWDMGLIDEDFLTMDGATYRNKALNGEIGIAWTAMSEFTNIKKDAANEGVESKWVAISYPRTEAGNPTSIIQTTAQRVTNTIMFSATSSEEELAVALQVWNYAFTEEGHIRMAYGIEGETHTKDANGEIQWADFIRNGELGIHAESQKYSMRANNGIPGILPDHLIRLKNDPEVAKGPDLWTENTKAYDHVLPLIMRNAEEEAIHSQYWNAISTYVKEETTKFFCGKRSLDEYDDFVKTLYEMGLQQLLDANQSAVDRYAK